MIDSVSRERQLKANFTTANGDGAVRPIVTSLNGDNSWLWSFPRPPSERTSTGKAYYHIVFEPWLCGPTSMLSTWFIHLQLPSAAAASSGAADVEQIVQQIETAAAGPGEKSNISGNEDEPIIDAILLGFHYLDHTHQPTLLTFDKRIPVIATPEAAAIVKEWNHFESIHIISNLSSGAKTWQTPEVPHPGGLPSWLTPFRLPGHHELNYCFVLVWTHSSSTGIDIHEAIVQSPHGIRPGQSPLKTFLEIEPPTQKLALFHGLKESRGAGSQNTFGAESGLAMYREMAGTKHWVVSHNSALQYSGIMMRLLWVHDTPRTIEWALEKSGMKDSTPNVAEVGNGGVFILN